MELITKNFTLGSALTMPVDVIKDSPQFEDLFGSYFSVATTFASNVKIAGPPENPDQMLNEIGKSETDSIQMHQSYSTEAAIDPTDAQFPTQVVIENAATFVAKVEGNEVITQPNTGTKSRHSHDRHFIDIDSKISSSVTKALTENADANQEMADLDATQPLSPSINATKIEPIVLQKNLYVAGTNDPEVVTEYSNSKISDQKMETPNKQRSEYSDNRLTRNAINFLSKSPTKLEQISTGPNLHLFADEKPGGKSKTNNQESGSINRPESIISGEQKTKPVVQSLHIADKSYEKITPDTVQNIDKPKTFLSVVNTTPDLVTMPTPIEVKTPKVFHSQPEQIFVDLIGEQQIEGEPGLADIPKYESGSANTAVQTKYSVTVITPRLVAAMVDAAATLPDRPVEISFNPEELGRVRLTMLQNDGNMLVAISTERPETQDFLRRHIDVLANQLRELGYQDVKFEYSGEQSTFANHQPQNTEFVGDDEVEKQSEIPVQRLRSIIVSNGRIDIRM